MPRRRDTPQHGQATVELALGFPLVAVMLLCAAQVVLVARDQLAVVHASREGARAAAVSATPAAAAATAARHATQLAPIGTNTTSSAGTVTVTVDYTSRTDVPLVGALLPDIRLTGRTTMRFEPS